MVTTHKKICTEYTQNKKRKESKYITIKKNQWNTKEDRSEEKGSKGLR